MQCVSVILLELFWVNNINIYICTLCLWNIYIFKYSNGYILAKLNIFKIKLKLLHIAFLEFIYACFFVGDKIKIIFEAVIDIH